MNKQELSKKVHAMAKANGITIRKQMGILKQAAKQHFHINKKGQEFPYTINEYMEFKYKAPKKKKKPEVIIND